MANEAVVVNLGSTGGEVYNFNVADGTGIEKGTICKLSGARVAVASAADGDVFAGIAANEKVASDGSTKLGLYTKGIFDLKTDAGGCSYGNLLKISGANLVGKAAADGAGTTTSGQCIVGVALEDASADEVVQVLIG